MVTKFAELVLRFRWFIILITFLTVGAASSGLKYFDTDTDYRVFFKKGNPQLDAFEKIQDNYDKSDNILIILTPESGSVFTKDVLEAIFWLTEESWQVPYSSRVDSITNFQHTKSEDDDLLVADLVSDPDELTEASIAEIKSISLNEPLLKKRLISPDGKVTAINVNIKLPELSSTETPETVAYVRDLTKRFNEIYPDIEVRLTGVIMLNNTFVEVPQQDMAKLIPIMFLIVIIILGLLLRSVSATFATVLVIFMSILTALGLFFFFGFKMTGPLTGAPTIILTMAVADSVHLLSNFFISMRNGANKHDALVDSIRINFQPILITSVTTAIGFLTMNFAEVPPLTHLGNVVAIGVMVAFILSITFLPAMIAVLPIRVKVDNKNLQDAQTRKTFLRALSEFVIKYQNKSMITMIIISLLFISFIPKNEINDEFVKYFDESIDFRVHTEYGSEKLLGPYTFEFNLQTDEDNGISDPKYLSSVQQFIDYVETFDEVSHVYSLTDIMKRLNKNLHGDNPEWYRLPDNRQQAAQYLLLYEMSLPYGLDLTNLIDINKSSTKVTITTKNLSSKRVIELEKNWGNWLSENASDIEYIVSSPGIMFAHVGQRNANSLIGGIGAAIVLISIILIFALRSVKLGLLSLAPNLLPILIGFGFWGMYNGMVGFGLSMVVGMTLGIVVDDSVHFMSKYLRATREKQLSSEDAIHYAFSTVGRALIITSIVLICGFMVLSSSSFLINAQMGLLTSITIGIALIIDFFLLPPLLIKLASNKTS